MTFSPTLGPISHLQDGCPGQVDHQRGGQRQPDGEREGAGPAESFSRRYKVELALA